MTRQGFFLIQVALSLRIATRLPEQCIAKALAQLDVRSRE
jgi:hypothetical protein